MERRNCIVPFDPLSSAYGRIQSRGGYFARVQNHHRLSCICCGVRRCRWSDLYVRSVFVEQLSDSNHSAASHVLFWRCCLYGLEVTAPDCLLIGSPMGLILFVWLR